jgi:hypothetical protein
LKIKKFYWYIVSPSDLRCIHRIHHNMKIDENWQRFSLYLKFTNNKMVILIYKDNDFFYFSQNEYKTYKDTIKKTNEFMRTYNS